MIVEVGVQYLCLTRKLIEVRGTNLCVVKLVLSEDWRAARSEDSFT